MPEEEKHPQYLKITCPNKECQQELVLICPHCHEGALLCSTISHMLCCHKCHHSMPSITCNCGFTIKASYILEKQRTLQKLQKHADPSHYTSIIKVLASLGAMLWFLLMLN